MEKAKEYIKDLKEKLLENPETVFKSLVKNMNKNRKFYQRIAYETYEKKCSKCGREDGQIDVHHKDKNRKNNRIDNLQVLCASCHAKIHKIKNF